jgi:hypothetical protein
MIRPATQLEGYQLLARDGTVGEVRDFVFDDDCWSIRYLVIDTGRWLSARRVMISPEAVRQPEWDSRRLPTELTKEQVRQSPAFDLSEATVRATEAAMRKHYGWAPYWPGSSEVATSSESASAAPDPGGDAVSPAVSPGAGADAELAAAARGAQEAQDGVRLRTVREVIGYHVEAIDGSIGHIEDFLVDDGTWDVRFVVVGTRNWWPGKKVLLSPLSITNVSWAESHVAVGLTREEIQNGPLYDPAVPVEDVITPRGRATP